MEHRGGEVFVFVRHPQTVCGKDARVSVGVSGGEGARHVAPLVWVDGHAGEKVGGEVLLGVFLQGGEDGRGGIICYGDLESTCWYCIMGNEDDDREGNRRK